MAAGKPIIGSKIGGIKETIKETSKEKTGILVEPGNVNELHQTIKKLMINPKLKKTLGNKGRIEARKYNEKEVIKKLVKIYQK